MQAVTRVNAEQTSKKPNAQADPVVVSGKAGMAGEVMYMPTNSRGYLTRT
jgi:hypothetical protein